MEVCKLVSKYLSKYVSYYMRKYSRKKINKEVNKEMYFSEGNLTEREFKIQIFLALESLI